MYVLITYDVNTTEASGRKRLRQVANCCKDFGQRVQNSVFECLLTEQQLLLLRNRLLFIIDKDSDSIRIYRLGQHYHTKIEHLGQQTAFDFEGELII